MRNEEKRGNFPYLEGKNVIWCNTHELFFIINPVIILKCFQEAIFIPYAWESHTQLMSFYFSSVSLLCPLLLSRVFVFAFSLWHVFCFRAFWMYNSFLSTILQTWNFDTWRSVMFCSFRKFSKKNCSFMLTQPKLDKSKFVLN